MRGGAGGREDANVRSDVRWSGDDGSCQRNLRRSEGLGEVQVPPFGGVFLWLFTRKKKRSELKKCA